MKPRHIWAVGRNYKNHAKEMNAPIPQEPLIFLKAGGCAHFDNTVELPSWIKEVHHEIELVLKFDENLQFSEFGLALDLTERHYQNLAKTQGMPWTTAKSFKNACPVSKFKKITTISHIEALSLELEINGTLKQKGFLKDLIFPLPILRDYVIDHFPIEAGDWLLTGTPSGVGPLKSGDQLVAKLIDPTAPGNLIEMNWLIK